MAHLTNFSFEFFYEIFTEDASPFFLYHGAKKSIMTKNSNQGGKPSEICRCIDAVLCRWLHPLLRKKIPAWGWACRIRHPWRGCAWNERTKSCPGENSCNVYHTSIYNWHSGSDMQWHSNKNGDTSSASWSNRRWSAFMERTRKPSV